MITYKYTNADNTHVFKFVDGVCTGGGLIADDEYLAWLAEGNTPEPADPLPPPVYTCSPWQIRKALNAANMRQAVEDAVAASTDVELKDGWEFATEFRSDDPFVINMGAALGMDAEQTALFVQAASHL